MKPKMQLVLVFALVLLLPQILQAQQPTSREIPFNNVATTIAPGSPGQALTLQVWDDASPPTLQFSEAQTLDVDANGAISFKLGSATPGGLDPNKFPSGSSRFLDVLDATSTSVLPNPPGRLPLNAVPFALSAGALMGNAPLVAASASIHGNGSDVFIGDVGCPPGTGGIGLGTLAPCRDFALGMHADPIFPETVINRPPGGHISFREANGPDQMTILPGGGVAIQGNTLKALIGDLGCGGGLSGLGSVGFSGGLQGCTNHALLSDQTNTFLNRRAGGTLFFREGNSNASQMVIAPGGNVGIGINNPHARLDVNGHFADVMIGDPNCGGGDGTAAVGFVSGSGGLDCGNNFALGGDTTTKETVLNRPTGGHISFREANGPDQMTIKPGGDVQVPRGYIDISNPSKGLILRDIDPFGRLRCAVVGLFCGLLSCRIDFVEITCP